jgi:hypothetical protein
MRVDEIVGLGASIVALAMVSVAIINGDKTAKVIGAIGTTFSNSIKAATLR